MVESIFLTLGEFFLPDQVARPTTFYFSVGEVKKTVTLAPSYCRVEEGRTVEDADCVCKMGGDLFVRIWNEGYRPGMGDFLSGAIKSNNPEALKRFLRSFGR